MDVRFVSDEGIQPYPVGELERLLARDHGFVWVDIPSCDEEAARVLLEVFGFHPLAVRACTERNAVSKLRAYPDHVFVVQHAPELGTRLAVACALSHAIVSALPAEGQGGVCGDGHPVRLAAGAAVTSCGVV
jgi:hypothetical protein